MKLNLEIENLEQRIAPGGISCCCTCDCDHDKEKGNNGFGNGGDDGSPNGKEDVDR
jgi:hypothetical protein